MERIEQYIMWKPLQSLLEILTKFKKTFASPRKMCLKFSQNLGNENKQRSRSFIKFNLRTEKLVLLALIARV